MATGQNQSSKSPPYGTEASRGKDGAVQLLVSGYPPSRPTWQPNAAPVDAQRVEPEPASPLPPANATERAIRTNPAYLALSAADRATAEQIIRKAASKTPEVRGYYLDALDALFQTPYSGTPGGPSPSLEASNRAAVDNALAKLSERLNSPDGPWNELEELLSGMDRKWTLRSGVDGTLYRVDRSDPRFVVVQAKVKVVGETEFAAKIKALEDAIEKAASTTGYHVDLVFTERSGPDVFEVQAAPGFWPTSLNWAREPETLAHELHHLLGLRDRYDHIQVHATNSEVDIPRRLTYFLAQMDLPPDIRGPASLMGAPEGTLLSEDVCAVVGGDQAACQSARKAFDPADLTPLRRGQQVHVR